MVRYFYAWTPVVVVGAVFLMSLPWLALIALVMAVLAALAGLAALAWVIVEAPIAVGRALGQGWQGRSAAREPASALVLAERRRV